MRRIRGIARDVLEGAAALYALVVLTLLLRAANSDREEAISDYERGRRDERLARLDAATERAKAVSQGIEREAFEEMKRRVEVLETAPPPANAERVYVRPAADIAARAKAELEGKGEKP